MKLSVVAPAYNEEEVLPEFINRVTSLLELLMKSGKITDWELIIVDDGSTDNTWNIIREAHSRNPRIKGIKLSRNFGHHNAITAGLRSSKGDLTIFMDSDLQARPEDIPLILDEYLNGYEVIWGIASEREDSLFVKLTSKLFAKLFNKMSPVYVPGDVVMVGFSKRALNYINEIREVDRYLDGLWAYVGFRSKEVKLKKEARKGGKPKYTFSKRLKLALYATISFTKGPLRLATYLGIFSAILGLSLGIYIIIKKLVWNTTLPGYASIFSAITIFFSMNFIILGIIGEYIGVLVDEVKSRPLYIVEEELLGECNRQ